MTGLSELISTMLLMGSYSAVIGLPWLPMAFSVIKPPLPGRAHD